jgi:hypothetical protein
MWGTRGPFPPAAVMVSYGCADDVGHWKLTSDQPNVGIVEIVYGSIFSFLRRSIHTFLTADPALNKEELDLRTCNIS